MKFAWAILLIFLLSPAITSAAEITVTGTDGSDIQTALDSANSGDTIIIPAGNYDVYRRIYQQDKSFSIIGEGDVTLKMHSPYGLKNGLYFKGSQAGASALSKTSKKGSNEVTLKDASTASAGYLIKIYNNNLWCPLDYPDQKTGELYEIKSVSGNTITLTEPLLRDYSTADSSQAIILRPVEIHIENIKIQDSDSTGDRMAITLECCKDSTIKNVAVKDSGIAGITLYSCFNCEVFDCDVRNSIKGGSGYGIGAWSGSAKINIHDNYIENCRHCVTGNTNERITLLRDITISNNEIIGGGIVGANTIDAHATTINYLVTGNKITVQPGLFAFIDGSLDSEFSGNEVYGGGGAVVFRGNINGGTHTIINNYVDVGAVCYFYGKGSKDLLQVENNVLGPSATAIRTLTDGVKFSKIIETGNVRGSPGGVERETVSPRNVVNPVRDVGAIEVASTDGKSDQEQINEALKKVHEAGGGTVDLGSSTYIIDGTIWIYPGITLKGNGAEIRIDPDSSWWFREGIPAIGCKGNPHDIEISGISIDGNCGAFPSKWANDGKDKAHNCMKLIILAGSSNDFGQNIFIHDCTFYNSFSDAIYIRFVDNVKCSDNFISNCQHEGIYLSACTNCIISNNKIDGITSDCMRLDNCQNWIVEYNTCHSYGGDSYGAYKHGENGIQIGDAGSSMGYSAEKSKFKTKNGEVRFNTFSDPGLKAIWLHDGTENVYIHDNEFIDADELETHGISKGISYDNPPSIEDSEEVFDSIFEIFNMNFYTTVSDDDSVILPDGVESIPSSVIGTVEYYKVGNDYTTFIHIPKEGLTEIIYEVRGVKTTHTLMIGERTINGVVFTETSIWRGDLPHDINALRLSGKVELNDIKVMCVTPTGAFEPTLKTVTTEFKPVVFHPAALLLILVFLMACAFIRMSIKHML